MRWNVIRILLYVEFCRNIKRELEKRSNLLMGSRVELQKLEGFTCVCGWRVRMLKQCADAHSHKKIISSIIICCYSWLTYWARNSFEWWRLYDLSKWKKSFLSLFCLRSIIIHGERGRKQLYHPFCCCFWGSWSLLLDFNVCCWYLEAIRNQSNFSTKLRQNFREMFCPRGQNFGL